MRLRTFTARNMAEAIADIRREMGPDAVIVASTRTGIGNVEVRAAVDGPAPLPDRAPEPSHEPPAEPDLDAPGPKPPIDLQAVCVRALYHHGAPDELAVALAAHAVRLGAAEPVAALARAFESRFAFGQLPLTPHRPLMLVGAPGAGKTSVAARLAARAALGGGGRRPRLRRPRARVEPRPDRGLRRRAGRAQHRGAHAGGARRLGARARRGARQLRGYSERQSVQ